RLNIAGKVRADLNVRNGRLVVDRHPDLRLASCNIEAGAPADLQVVLDGRRSNTSQIVAGYLSQIGAALAAEKPAGKRAGA
ncbi:ABC transporter permease, partial [Rhizobium leguminosarum]